MEALQLEAAQIGAACYVQESVRVGLFHPPSPSAVSFNLSEIKLIGGCWIQGTFLCVSCPGSLFSGAFNKAPTAAWILESPSLSLALRPEPQQPV